MIPDEWKSYRFADKEENLIKSRKRREPDREPPGVAAHLLEPLVQSPPNLQAQVCLVEYVQDTGVSVDPKQSDGMSLIRQKLSNFFVFYIFSNPRTQTGRTP